MKDQVIATISGKQHPAEVLESLESMTKVRVTDGTKPFDIVYGKLPTDTGFVWNDLIQPAGKHDVLAFGEPKPTLDPKTCNHQNAFTTYDDIDGKLRHCPDCNATLDEDGQIVQVVDEIPF